jgi:hypothetical protein
MLRPQSLPAALSLAVALTLSYAPAWSAVSSVPAIPADGIAPAALGAGLIVPANAACPPEFAAISAAGAAGDIAARPITFEAVSYRPRGRYRDRDRSPWYGSDTQVHAGFFDPTGDGSQGFVLGVRGGPRIDPHLQLGVGVDWEHRGDQQSQVLGSSSGPGGTVITTRRQLSSSSENTFPILAYLQVQGDESMPVIPYAGIGGAYEVVTLSATDFASGSTFDATYGGWGWQAWAGAKIPMSGHSGLVAEVFTNRAEASRDVYDAVLAATFRETVKLDGFGMRFGVTWGM